jgi:predicted Rossmann-fold nucleotide-binding protein
MVSKDYWQGLLDWIKEKMMHEKNISPADMDIFSVVDTAEEAVGTIEEYYNKYALKPNF